MVDVHDFVTRSYNMSRIRNKDTKPEMLVRRYLFSKGFRYRLNVKSLPGKPDLVLPKYKKIIFINGCFWHGHKNCIFFKLPKTNTAWWEQKINSTIQRDQENVENLMKLGWNVITIWECELQKKIVSKTLDKIIKRLII